MPPIVATILNEGVVAGTFLLLTPLLKGATLLPALTIDSELPLSVDWGCAPIGLICRPKLRRA
jgi:hypothetical protein